KREIPDVLGRFGVVDPPEGISRFGDRHRAYVKVQDGCLLRCSYCIIPYVRPRMWSRPTDAILDEVRRLVDNGYREIVLTGIHLGHYGVDFNQGRPRSTWVRLADLVRGIVGLPGTFRVRLSSIEATEVTRGLLEVMGEFPDRVCPHLHICMQSGSDAVLRRMNRRWGARRFLDRCQLASQTLDQPALTTDVIVGFPGESDADFEATCELTRACGFSKVHIFPFSPRKGTPAAEMPDPIAASTRQQRQEALQLVEAACRESYVRGLKGRTLQVLVESPDPDDSAYVWGTSCRYVPVRLSQRHRASGELTNVVAGESCVGGLRGQLPSEHALSAKCGG
ncbi:MAG TPA: MiaB/RimO family radical SAM methylthiotransferase, partial [Pirellulaceae bacterium]